MHSPKSPTFFEHFFVMLSHANVKSVLILRCKKDWQTRCWIFYRNRLGRSPETDSLTPLSHALCILPGLMFQPYTVRWKRSRKLFSRTTRWTKAKNQNPCKKFEQKQASENRWMLKHWQVEFWNNAAKLFCISLASWRRLTSQTTRLLLKPSTWFCFHCSTQSQG